MSPTNLLIPFRRDRKRDFAVGSGDALLTSKVRQVLLTEGATPSASGELPWRTSFGASLGLLRHQRNDLVLAELARVHSRTAIARWIPGATITSLTARQDEDSLVLTLSISEGRSGSSVAVRLSR